MSQIDIDRMNVERMRKYLDQLCTLFINVVRGENPAGYVDTLDRDAVRSYWEYMECSVLSGNSIVFAAFIDYGIFGAAEFRVVGREKETHGCGVERLLVDPRFRREQVTWALLNAVNKEARAAGIHRDMYRFPLETGTESTRDPPGGKEAVPPPAVRPATIMLPRERPGFQIQDEIAVVPVKDLDLSADFYQNKLGLRLLSFRYIGLFFYTGSGTLVLQAVDTVHPLPWPIVEWYVVDLYGALAELKSRNVTIVRNRICGEDWFGVFAHADGGRAAVVRDPDRNLLALREPAKRED